MKFLGSLLILLGAAVVVLYSVLFSFWELARTTLAIIITIVLVGIGTGMIEMASAAGDWDEPQEDDSKDSEDS